jgi:proteasome accessory factor PafA2
MSIPKVVGMEQEYAISVKGADDLSVFQASCMLVNGYANKAGIRKPGIKMLWDYGHETPFRDIRGELFGKKSGQEITRDEDNLLINTILPNGARLYTDHAHPEYSTPECLSAREVIACDKAGERILVEALRTVKEILPSATISLFKNNVDHQGHSYGCHENYLMEARAHEEYLVRSPGKSEKTLIPFLITRQVFAGSGKAGDPFQVSQRADFMESVFGLETMFARPIINTRQEHHADPARFRRLHLIVGDSNMCEYAGLLKVGATQIVLQMMEDDFITSDLSLKEPLRAIKQVSSQYDAIIELADGRRTTAIDVQRRFLDRALEYRRKPGVEHIPGVDIILKYWACVLDGLRDLKLSEDFDLEDDPGDMRQKLDWVLKLWLFNRYRRRKGMNWNDPRLKVLDLQYHNIDSNEGVFYSLEQQGLTERILEEAEIETFLLEAPPGTRAYFRSRCIKDFPQEVFLVNWEVVGFDHGDLHRMVPLLNPLKGGRDRFQEVFDRAGDSKGLLRIMKSLDS